MRRARVAVEPQARGPAPGGMTACLADQFVGQLTPAVVQILVVLCRHAPEMTYEALQAAWTAATTTPTSNAPAGKLGL